VLALATSAGLLRAQAYTTIVVFGDSLSDTGNFAHLSNSAYGAVIPGPIADYTAGRFTDGTDTNPAAHNFTGVWVEQLAASLTANPAIKDSLDGGLNYAVGSATTASGTTVVQYGPSNSLTVTVPNVAQQIATYLATKPTITSKTLFVVWCGANDLINATSAAQIVAAANNDVANIQTLIAAGATDILIPNLPPLGAVPRFNTIPAASAQATGAVEGYNQALAYGLSQLPAANTGKTLHLFTVDAFSLFNSILPSPAVFGLVDVTHSSQTLAVNPDTYTFWDDLHPTTAVHHLIATTAHNALTETTAATNALTLSTATAIPNQSVTLKAVVASTVASASSAPTGLVTFYNSGTPIATVAIDVTGTAKTTLAAPAVSSTPYSITAAYAGDPTFYPITSAASSLTVIATPVPTTTAVVTSYPNANLGAPITLTATVSSPIGPPTGSVTFLDGSTVLASPTLIPGTTNSTASLTISTLTAGTHTITVLNNANSTYAASTSGALSQVVVAPAVTLAGSPSSATVPSGTSAVTLLTISPVGGLTGTYNLTCPTLPSASACSFSSSSFTFNGSNTPFVTLVTIGTETQAAFNLPNRPGAQPLPQILSAFLLLPSLGGLFLLTRRRKQLHTLPKLALLFLLSAASFAGLTGCGNSTSGPNELKTPAGTYTVPITLTPTGTGTAVTTNFTLTVV
jgi:phospholipase/lecithinase/hemolysin